MSGNTSSAPSYACGVADQPLMFETIGNAFDRMVHTHPDRTAIVFRHQDIRWSYREFQAQVDACAAGLLALGLVPGDRVGIWAPNCAEWVITQYATAKAGLIQVNINPAYRPQELAYCLNKVGCKALITAPKFKTSDYIGIIDGLIPELASAEPGKLTSADFPALEIVVRLGSEASPGFLNFNDVCNLVGDAERARLAELSNELQPDDPINIQFTSGTTGSPKGATLSHFNILNNAWLSGLGMGMSADDVLVCPLPLYHCAGMVVSSLTCVTMGATCVYPDEAFEPTSVLAAVAEEKATVLVGVPTMFLAQLDHPEFANTDVSSLRTGFIGGAPCPIELMKRILTDFHMAGVTIVYGMTETSPVSFQTALDDPTEKRVGTVGRVHPHVEARVVDDEGRTVPRGVQGEVLVRGYLVMPGYWEDTEKTAEAIDSAGWMHTGDLGVMDDEGYLNITGRAKDMLIRGGENIYPREVEEFLYTHPDIQEVQVFGIPDHKMGEEVCAWVQKRPGSDLTDEDIRTYCQGELSHFKIPRFIRFVDEYPMTVSGKIQKFAMRDVMINELGLEVEATA
jgi:fatty-acyl-CoA synthase